MNNIQKEEHPLEERTYRFARDVRIFSRRVPRTLENIEDLKQLVRSSGSVAANYIEANESLGKKDCFMRMKISRKEAKESRLWLRLIDTCSKEKLENERIKLLQEATELTLIFGSIVQKVKDK